MKPRVLPVFGLTLLEVLRDQDLPEEILEDENVTVTMPRKLGLSDVIDKQIRSYRDAVKQRRRMSDDQVRDLVRLVVRRPDARQVFAKAGAKLAGGMESAGPRGLFRALPRVVALRMARRATSKGLRNLFGRSMGGFGQGPYALEGRGLLFHESDPSGAACQFVTGYCQAVLSQRLGSDYQVVHPRCQSLGDPTCRWTVTGEARVRERDGVREMLLRPEVETG
ncbi:MAG: hypothetical protein P8188_00035 [Gemmatimonadota bacterium]